MPGTKRSGNQKRRIDMAEDMTEEEAQYWSGDLVRKEIAAATSEE